MSFCFCTDQKDVAKNIYEVNRELDGGELSLSACPGVGNRPLRKKKIENLWGCVWGHGGMVTSKIEPCICCVTEWKLRYEVDFVSQSVLKWYFEQF